LSNCQFTSHGRSKLRCIACGRLVRLGDIRARHCRSDSPKRSAKSPQLGDRLESLLKKVGITEEKYRELKVMAGFSPTCNCPQRHRFLNKLPAALALGYARGGICGAYNSAVQLAQENKEYFSKPR